MQKNLDEKWSIRKTCIDKLIKGFPYQLIYYGMEKFDELTTFVKLIKLSYALYVDKKPVKERQHALT